MDSKIVSAFTEACAKSYPGKPVSNVTVQAFIKKASGRTACLISYEDFCKGRDIDERLFQPSLCNRPDLFPIIMYVEYVGYPKFGGFMKARNPYETGSSVRWYADAGYGFTKFFVVLGIEPLGVEELI